MNINDWKVIQMRNDVKYIKRNIMGNSAANWSLVVDVFLVLLAFVLDQIFGETEGFNVWWVIIATAGVLLPLAFFVAEVIVIKRRERISRRVLNTKELVQMFDDEICYMIMSAETFNKNLKVTDKIDSQQSALLIEFHAIEVSYYLNKAVHLILKMDNNLTEVLDEDDITKNHISKERLVNSIRLIASLYEELFAFAETKSADLAKFSVALKLKDAKEKYNSLKKFVDRKKKLIGIDTPNTFRESENN